jgi:hypothetical protein
LIATRANSLLASFGQSQKLKRLIGRAKLALFGNFHVRVPPEREARSAANSETG